MPIVRRALPCMLLSPAALAQPLIPIGVETPTGQALVARLRQGGLILFFRHADTRGEPCDSSFRVGDRPGQRNLSPAGRMQARRIDCLKKLESSPVWSIQALCRFMTQVSFRTATSFTP